MDRLRKGFKPGDECFAARAIVGEMKRRSEEINIEGAFGNIETDILDNR